MRRTNLLAGFIVQKYNRRQINGKMMRTRSAYTGWEWRKINSNNHIYMCACVLCMDDDVHSDSNYSTTIIMQTFVYIPWYILMWSYINAFNYSSIYSFIGTNARATLISDCIPRKKRNSKMMEHNAKSNQRQRQREKRKKTNKHAAMHTMVG